MKTLYSRVSTKGRVVIPAELRHALDLLLARRPQSSPPTLTPGTASPAIASSWSLYCS